MTSRFSKVGISREEEEKKRKKEKKSQKKKKKKKKKKNVPKGPQLEPVDRLF